MQFFENLCEIDGYKLCGLTFGKFKFSLLFMTVTYVEFLGERFNTHLPQYSTLKSFGILSPKRFEPEEEHCGLKRLGENIPKLFSVPYSGKWALSLSPNIFVFLCPATVGSC